MGLWAGGEFLTLKYESIALNSWFVVTSGLGYGASEGLKRTLDNKSSDNSIYPPPKKAKGVGGELLLQIDFMPLFEDVNFFVDCQVKINLTGLLS